MPFVTAEHRAKPNLDIPGDLCYTYYKHLIEKWRNEPRWTTAHNLYKEMLNEQPYLGIDQRAAYQLAWQVFFQLRVMPYEMQKMKENGDII